MIPVSSGLYHMSPVGKEKKRKVSLPPSLLNDFSREAPSLQREVVLAFAVLVL